MAVGDSKVCLVTGSGVGGSVVTYPRLSRVAEMLSSSLVTARASSPVPEYGVTAPVSKSTLA